MKTVTLSLSTQDESDRRALAAFSGEPQGTIISFASVDLLWKTLTRKRWELLAAMTGKGAMTFRAAADLVGRDVKAVHTDLTALALAGLVDRKADGVEFPYDDLRVAFSIRAAA